MPSSYSLVRSVLPAGSVIALCEAKDHMRIPPTDTGQDIVIGDLIAAAERKVEDDADMSLLSQTWHFRTPHFRNLQAIPRPPLAGIVLKYTDTGGTERTVDAGTYRVHVDNYPGVVSLLPDKEWPTDVEDSYLPILYEVTAGSENRLGVPPQAKQAILLLATHWYEHRQAVDQINMYSVPQAYDALIAQLKPGTYTLGAY